MTDRTGFRGACPECGYEGYFRQREVARSVADLHDRQDHGGDPVSVVSEVERVPPGAFPEEPDQEEGARVVADA